MEEEEPFIHKQELFMKMRGGADPLFELGEGEEERGVVREVAQLADRSLEHLFWLQTSGFHLQL